MAINSAIAVAACLAPPPGFQRATSPVCKAKKAVIEPDSFDFDVDLGDNGGIVEHVQLEPYFSRSSLVTVRLPLPFNLDVEPVQGVYRVNIDGYGLMVGDILRAFSTIRMRYDSDLKEVRVAQGCRESGAKQSKQRTAIQTCPSGWRRSRRISTRSRPSGKTHPPNASSSPMASHTAE